MNCRPTDVSRVALAVLRYAVPGSRPNASTSPSSSSQGGRTRRVATLCRSPRAHLLRVGLRRPGWHRHEAEDAEDSRAVLWISHQRMISLRSSAELIAALPSLTRGPWISSSRFGDKWSRHASTGSSRALPSLVEDPCRRRLPAPPTGRRCRRDSE